MDQTTSDYTEFNFQGLQPCEVDNIEGYRQAFDYAFSDRRVKNIALTGSYGAGKSSVLETYKKQDTEHRYLHISLAHFQDKLEEGHVEPGKPREPKETKELERMLEGKIINQLVHKIGEEHLRHSRISVRTTPSQERVENWVCFLFAFGALTMYLLRYGAIAQMDSGDKVIRIVKGILTTPTVFVSALILEMAGIFLLLTFLVMAQMRHRFFRKICIRDSEIQLFEEEDKDSSYFDKYLDELKYLFQHADADVIVFEDIDRYDINLIFEKLREINGIINHNSKCREPIRFLYLVRDDLFVQKERTKFFDFIIPVLPVINHSNAFEVFLRLFRNEELGRHRLFLKQISLYVDDMRILKNIYNEFRIYKEQLKNITVESSSEKIFALLVYKNLFPSDFSRFQMGMGYVAAFFTEKERMAQERRAGLEEELRGRSQKQERKWKVYIDYKRKLEQWKTKGQDREEDREEYFQKLARHEAACRKLEAEYWEENRGVREREQKIEELGIVTLKKYIEEYGYDELEDAVRQRGEKLYREAASNPYFGLIAFLLRGGYIDESSNDLMVVVHEDDMPLSDRKYVRSVLDGSGLAYDYRIQMPERVAEYLTLGNIGSASACNLDMFDYYLKAGDYDQANVVAKVFCEHEKYEFLELVIDRGQAPYEKWIPRMGLLSSEFVLQFNRKAAKKENATILITALLLYGSGWMLQSCMAGDGQGLLEGIRDETSFEAVLAHDCIMTEEQREEKLQRMVHNMQEAEVKFSHYDFKIGTQDQIGELIYENNLYTLNVHNICGILTGKYGMQGIKPPKLYDSISESDRFNEGRMTPIHTYTINNIDTFLEEMQREGIAIKPAAAQSLFLVQVASDDKAAYVVRNMEHRIEKANDIREFYKLNMLIKEDKLEHTTANILQYHKLYYDKRRETTAVETENCLFEYISHFEDDNLVFDREVLDSYDWKDEEQVTDLFEEITCDVTMSEARYASLLKSMGYTWTEVSDVQIPEERMDIIIGLGIIEVSRDNLLWFHEHMEAYLPKYLAKEIKRYLRYLDGAGEFVMEECLMILDSDVSEANKIKLLRHTSEPISIKGRDWPESVIAHILENNYDASDIGFLRIQNYQGTKLRRLVAEKLQEEG